jgi:hypothetical protein
MPRVGRELRGRGVVAGHGDHAGLARGEEVGHRRVEPLDRADLRGSVPVLAGRIGVLVVDEEEVCVIAVLLEQPIF